MNSVQEILSEIQKLPVVEQKELLDKLSSSLEEPPITEDEFEQMLLAEGVISQIPPREYDPEEETYEPIEIEGEPLSETMIRERR